MLMAKKYIVELMAEEQELLVSLTRSGKMAARKLRQVVPHQRVLPDSFEPVRSEQPGHAKSALHGCLAESRAVASVDADG